MNERHITIYLVLGALGAIAADQLRRSSLGSSLVINFSNLEIDSYALSQVYKMPSAGGIFTWLEYRRLARNLRRIRKQYKRVDVAIPHTFHLVANHLFHQTRRGDSICLPDGSLTLTPMQLRTEQKRSMVYKWLAAPFLGYRYRRYSGSLHGFDDFIVDKVVTFYESAFLPRGREIQILDLGQETPTDPDTCLILDQPLGRTLHDNDQVPDVRDAIAKVARDYPNVLIKLHPNQSEPEIAPQKQGFNYLDPKVPAESCITQYAPAAVIGTCSTALVTLKMVNPQLKCIVVGLNRVEKVRPEFKDFRKLLRRLGASFLDV